MIFTFKRNASRRSRSGDLSFAMTLVFSVSLVLSSSSQAKPPSVVSEQMMNHYRARFGPSPYWLVYEDGARCCDRFSKKRPYLLDLNAEGPGRLIYSREIHDLVKGSFEIEFDRQSVLQTPHGIFIVMNLMRPAEYNPKYRRCAVGMGEHRSYLIAVRDDKVDVINRYFGGCTERYLVIREGDALGYRLDTFSEPFRSARFMLRGDSIVREPDYLNKDSGK